MYHHDINNPYETMINNMADGFMHYSMVSKSSDGKSDYRLIEINKSLALSLGLTRDQLINKDFIEISALNENTSIFFNSLLEKMQSCNNSTGYEFHNPHNNKWYSLSVFDEADEHFTALFRDITQSKYMEEQIDRDKKYKNLFDFSADMLYIKDLNNNLTCINPAWYSTLGYAKGDMAANKSWDIVHPNDILKSQLEYENILKGKNIYNFENRFLCKNGEYKWFQWNTYSDIDKGLIYAVIRDVTKQKRIEEELHQSEERWQFALEGSGSGAWDWNIQTDETVYSNAWKTILGYGEDDITPSHHEWQSRIHPDDVESVSNEFQKYIDGKIPHYICEYRLKCSDGRYKWVLSRGKIIQWDEAGKPLRMIGIDTDITELKNLSEEHRKITEDYEIIFNGTHDALFLISVEQDEKLRFIRLNNTHERLTGFITQMVSGKTPVEVLGEELGRVVESNYIRCLREKRPIQYEEIMNLPTGEKIWNTLLSPVIRNGRVVYIVGSSRDITEQKTIEELKRRAEKEIEKLNASIAQENLKNEFFANLSHELRTPLNVIFASMQLLSLQIGSCSDLSLKNSIGKYLKIMRQNCFRLIRLVNNLIDITRIDAGYFSLSLENGNIVNVIEDITMSIAEYTENKSISLIFDTETEERIMAFDPDKIERIMLNLLSNAVKFTNPGGEINVNLYERKDKFYISIRDNGIGIPKDKLDIIFERFIQVDKSLTRSHEGSGIGLALVKSLVALHEGNIIVKSNEGEGSEFIIELPIRNIPDGKCPNHDENKIQNNIVEQIHIEFSDIYS